MASPGSLLAAAGRGVVRSVAVSGHVARGPGASLAGRSETRDSVKFGARRLSSALLRARRKLSLGQTIGDASDNPLSEQEWVEKHTSGSGCVP
jgi:hypothetical protein